MNIFTLHRKFYTFFIRIFNNISVLKCFNIAKIWSRILNDCTPTERKNVEARLEKP